MNKRQKRIVAQIRAEKAAEAMKAATQAWKRNPTAETLREFIAACRTLRQAKANKRATDPKPRPMTD